MAFERIDCGIGFYGTKQEVQVHISDKGEINVQEVSQNIFQRLYNHLIKSKEGPLWLTASALATFNPTDESTQNLCKQYEPFYFKSIAQKNFPLSKLKTVILTHIKSLQRKHENISQLGASTLSKVENPSKISSPVAVAQKKKVTFADTLTVAIPPSRAEKINEYMEKFSERLETLSKGNMATSFGYQLKFVKEAVEKGWRQLISAPVTNQTETLEAAEKETDKALIKLIEKHSQEGLSECLQEALESLMNAYSDLPHETVAEASLEDLTPAQWQQKKADLQLKDKSAWSSEQQVAWEKFLTASSLVSRLSDSCMQNIEDKLFSEMRMRFGMSLSNSISLPPGVKQPPMFVQFGIFDCMKIFQSVTDVTISLEKEASVFEIVEALKEWQEKARNIHSVAACLFENLEKFIEFRKFFQGLKSAIPDMAISNPEFANLLFKIATRDITSTDKPKKFTEMVDPQAFLAETFINILLPSDKVNDVDAIVNHLEDLDTLQKEIIYLLSVHRNSQVMLKQIEAAKGMFPERVKELVAMNSRVEKNLNSFVIPGLLSNTYKPLSQLETSMGVETKLYYRSATKQMNADLVRLNKLMAESIESTKGTDQAAKKKELQRKFIPFLGAQLMLQQQSVRLGFRDIYKRAVALETSKGPSKKMKVYVESLKEPLEKSLKQLDKAEERLAKLTPDGDLDAPIKESVHAINDAVAFVTVPAEIEGLLKQV